MYLANAADKKRPCLNMSMSTHNIDCIVLDVRSSLKAIVGRSVSLDLPSVVGFGLLLLSASFGVVVVMPREASFAHGRIRLCTEGKVVTGERRGGERNDDNATSRAMYLHARSMF